MNPNRKVKILFVLPALEAGGAERVLITLMNGLDRDKFTPVLLSVRGEGPLTSLISKDTVTHELNRRLDALSLIPLLQRIKKVKPDFVVSTMTHMNFALLLLKPFFFKTPFIVREAITPSFFFKGHAARTFIIKTLYKTLYPWANTTLSPTQKVFDEFKSLLNFIPKNAVVLKNSIDTNNLRGKITFSTNDLKDGDQNTVRFVACGRLHPQKGFDRIITALAGAKMPHNWRLDIIGEGDERAALAGLIKTHDLGDHIFLRGFMDTPWSIIAAADCFVMPSRFEGLPNVVLESLACGTPVIATAQSGGIDEIARHTKTHDLKVVKTMDHFIQAMHGVTPNNKHAAAPSLLPAIYERAIVMKQFENLILALNDWEKTV